MSRPPRPIIPSKAPSHRVPYMPDAQDVESLQRFIPPHASGNMPGQPGYIISTFDARPVNAKDFQSQSGCDARDTGYLPDQGTEGPGNDAYVTASIFYTVPQGYQAILRDYHLLIIPASGADTIAGSPIFGTHNVSNFPLTVSVLVNGTYQEGVAGITTWAGAFGDYFGECYVMANQGDTIEIRVTSPNETVSFYQMLINAHGNLLLTKSGQLEYAAATTATLPVREQGAV